MSANSLAPGEYFPKERGRRRHRLTLLKVKALPMFATQTPSSDLQLLETDVPAAGASLLPEILR